MKLKIKVIEGEYLQDLEYGINAWMFGNGITHDRILSIEIKEREGSFFVDNDGSPMMEMKAWHESIVAYWVEE